MGKYTAPTVMKEDKKSGPDSYEIDSWTRTVCEAMEILNDPAKMKHVKAAIEKKQKAIMSLEQVKKSVAKAG